MFVHLRRRLRKIYILNLIKPKKYTKTIHFIHLIKDSLSKSALSSNHHHFRLNREVFSFLILFSRKKEGSTFTLQKNKIVSHIKIRWIRIKLTYLCSNSRILIFFLSRNNKIVSLIWLKEISKGKHKKYILFLDLMLLITSVLINTWRVIKIEYILEHLLHINFKISLFLLSKNNSVNLSLLGLSEQRQLNLCQKEEKLEIELMRRSRTKVLLRMINKNNFPSEEIQKMINLSTP